MLESLGQSNGFIIETTAHDVGGIGIDNHGSALPESTLAACKEADAILFGSVGGPKVGISSSPKNNLNGQHYFPIRKAFELFANLRPGNLYPELADLFPFVLLLFQWDRCSLRERIDWWYLLWSTQEQNRLKMVRKKHLTP